MTFHSYLILAKRKWRIVLGIAILVTILAYSFALMKNKNLHKATVFLSIGVNESGTKENQSSSIYENVQAADQFAETVQGWFKNPDFLARIEKKSGFGSNITARKQEKQNLLVNFNTPTREQAERISEVIKNELVYELNTYNQQTNTAFQLALYTPNINEESVNVLLFLLLGILAGLALGIGIGYGYEYLFQLVSFSEQITEILKKNYLEKLSSLFCKKEKLHFLFAHLKKINVPITVAGINMNPAHLVKETVNHLPERTIRSSILPADAEKLGSAQYLLIVCQLGKTRLEDLKKLETFLPEKFDFIVIES